jgi:sarcosine oxidase
VYCGGWVDRRAGSIHPLNYVRGLVRAALERGIGVHGRSPVVDIVRCGAHWEVGTPAAKITARRVLICANAYSGDLAGGLKRTFIAPNSFQIATEPLPQAVRNSILREGHVASDARRLLLYYRLDPEGRLLLGGRGTFRNPQSEAGFDHLERGMKAMFPQAADAEIAFRWSGRVAITLDHLPHLHDLGEGLYAVSGYNGRGVGLSSALGKVLGQWLLDPANGLPLPMTKPRHIPLHRLQELYVAAGSAWYRFRDWMT